MDSIPTALGNPVFIRGLAPRCGTNYLGSVLACHQQVSVYPKSFWEFPPFRAHNLLDAYLLEIEQSPHVEGFVASEFVKYIGNAFLSYFESGNAVPLFKEPSVVGMQDMFAMFPHARVPIIVRDGRDIVASQLKSGFTLPEVNLAHPSTCQRLLPGGDFRILVKRLAQSAHALLEFLAFAHRTSASWSFSVIKYEDLVLRPSHVIPSLLDFIGLSRSGFDWALFEALPVRGSSFHKDPNNKMNFSSGVPKTQEFQPVHRYDQWSKTMLSYYDRIVGVAMSELGYD